MNKSLQWLNALSTRPSLESAIAEISDNLKASLSSSPDLGILFVSATYASEYPRVLPLLLEKFPLPLVIGCGGGGIVGMPNPDEVLEVEGNTAISLTVLSLPEVQITPFVILAPQIPDLDSSPETWTELIGVSAAANPQFIVLADPFSAKINDLLEGLDFAYPGAVKIGGLASSNTMGIPSALFYYDARDPQPLVYNEGTIGVALSGKIIIETIVAQGCRPIGQVYRVSNAERNVILELTEDLDGARARSPLAWLRELIPTLSEEDRQLVQNSLFIGIARDEFKSELTQGDFLIRNLLGVDPRLGAIAVGDRVRPGQRIRFHLRDARTSAEDLDLLLRNYQSTVVDRRLLGALMFSCLGRGEGLYGEPNFDSELLRRYFQNLPLGGFFCNGEIGPVAGRTFLHGYTSALGIFRSP